MGRAWPIWLMREQNMLASRHRRRRCNTWAGKGCSRAPDLVTALPGPRARPGAATGSALSMARATEVTLCRRLRQGTAVGCDRIRPPDQAGCCAMSTCAAGAGADDPAPTVPGVSGLVAGTEPHVSLIVTPNMSVNRASP